MAKQKQSPHYSLGCIHEEHFIVERAQPTLGNAVHRSQWSNGSLLVIRAESARVTWRYWQGKHRTTGIVWDIAEGQIEHIIRFFYGDMLKMTEAYWTISCLGGSSVSDETVSLDLWIRRSST